MKVGELREKLSNIYDGVDVAVKVVVADEILTLTFNDINFENNCAFLFLDEIIEVED